jgi:hypothetical protein
MKKADILVTFTEIGFLKMVKNRAGNSNHSMKNKYTS